MKKYKILLPVLGVLAAAAIVFAVLADDIAQRRQPETTTEIPYVYEDSAYTPRLSASGDIGFPLLPTDFNAVFCPADPGGRFSFLEFTGSGLTPYSGTTKTLTVTVTCSSQDIPVTLYYIEKDGSLSGYGLFTTALSDAPVYLYDYAFFKLTDLPPAYGKSGALLLVSFDKSVFGTGDKVYTEAFILNMTTRKTTRFTTENSRTVGPNGALRSDWIMLEDGFLKSLGKEALFLSGRDYTLDKWGVSVSILKNADIRPPRVRNDILGLWARIDGDALLFLRKTQNGFRAVRYADNTETVIREFEGDYFTDFVRDGNFVLDTRTAVVTDLFTGKQVTVEGGAADGKVTLCVNPGGTRAVIAATDTDKVPGLQTLRFADLRTGACETFTEPLLFDAADPGFAWTDENTLLHVRPRGENAAGLVWCAVAFTP